MKETNLGYTVKVNLDLPYEEALGRVKRALKEEGFGVLTEVDVRATMREKLGVGFRPYTIHRDLQPAPLPPGFGFRPGSWVGPSL